MEILGINYREIDISYGISKYQEEGPRMALVILAAYVGLRLGSKEIFRVEAMWDTILVNITDWDV